HRQPKLEAGAAADRALDADLAAQRVGELAADVEAEPGPAALAGPESGILLEDRLLQLRRDPGAGVRDLQDRPPAAPGARGPSQNRDSPAGGRILDRVREQVAQDLTDPVGIAPDQREPARDPDLESEPGLFGRRMVL